MKKTTEQTLKVPRGRLPNCSAASSGRFPRVKLSWCSCTFALVAIVGLTPGCGLLSAPKHVVNAVVPTKGSSQPDPIDLQVQLQRFTDDALTRNEQALERYAQIVGTDSAHMQALRLKLTCGSSLISIVSGPNPSANLLDLVSVTVLTRRTVEDYWIKTTNGTAFQLWLDVSRVSETNVWKLAGRFLQPAQVDELQQGISQWYASTPEMRTAFFARPLEFASMLRSSKEKGTEVNSVFSMVSLDPTAGLDPAVREVTRTRLFAERAMYTMQRMPVLIRMQTELLAYELAEQPSLQLALSNTTQLSDSADRISRAAESVGKVAIQLPDLISSERKEILGSLDQQESRLRGLVTEVDRALGSGEKMSDSLSITITNFDALMKRFGVGEATNATPDTNSTPFNILDYAKAADKFGGMARDFNTLVGSVNQGAPQIQRLSQEAGADLQKVVDHGFRLGLVLIGVLLGGAVVAGLVFRFFAEKLKASRSAEHVLDKVP